jgi:hypothetical protein
VAVSDACTVLIAATERLAALKARVPTDGELLAFSETEALAALLAITTRRPRLVALDSEFAASTRGAALIHRIQADPDLAAADIRILSETSDTLLDGPPVVVAASPVSGPLDQRGTRRAPRFRIPDVVGVMVDGNAATLVDLSTIGAQVLSGTILKPNQRVRIGLNDDHGAIRFNAAVAWAAFEIPANSSPRYRAGLAFVDADSEAVDAFCLRHRGGHHSS